MTRSFLLLAALIVSSGCDSGNTTPETTAVYVGNQGVFSDNSGSVTSYDPVAGTATQNAVPNLGGLVQAMKVHDGRLYILLNFSDSFSTQRGRIDVMDLATGARIQQIDVDVPRDMAFVGGTAYVTNFYSSSVTPITLATGQLGPAIEVGDNPEGIAVVENRIYVSSFSAGFDFAAGRDVRVFNAGANQVNATLDMGCDGPRSVLADNDDEVWVFCTGKTVYDADFNVVGRTNGAVVVLNGATGAVSARIPLTAQLGAASLGTDAAMSLANEEAFAIVGNEILRFNTASNTLAGRFTVAGAPIGAIAYDEASDELYLGRLDPASGFSADGFVSVHSRTGVELRRFSAGVIPASIAFAVAE